MVRLISRMLIALLIAILAFEGMSAAAVLTKVLPANAPTYRLPTFDPFWTVESRHFGVWHEPNATFNHATACYNLEYRSNSYGARDADHAREASSPRAIVLGDSFVEGFGLADADRVTDRLAAATAIPHLNFATAGGFGPIQYLQLYRHLARDFRHDAVIVGLLPDNDFLDNDAAHASLNQDPNYKPILIEEGDSYRLTFINERALGTSDKSKRRALRTGLRNFLRNFTFSANVIDYVKGVMVYRRPATAKNGYSGYYDATDAQIRRVQYVLKTLVSEAEGRPVYLIILPRLADVLAYRERGTPALAERFSGLVPVIDLLPAFADAKEPEALFNDCDRHWSGAGVRLAVEEILDQDVIELYRQ